MKNFLKIEGLSRDDGRKMLEQAGIYKKYRARNGVDLLKGQTWAMIFAKSSTRTRVSFEVGIHELGGKALFLNSNDIQLGRGEPIIDTARVLGRMVHGAVIRTFAQKDVENFASYSGLPTVNALTDDEHPCQIMTDIFTFEEKRGSIEGKKVAFIGDAACNMGISFSHAAEIFGFDLYCAAPEGFQTPVRNSRTHAVTDPKEAAEGADLLYTDVWVSMGKESEAAERERIFKGYQINHELLQAARKDALVLHCLPAYRGKEISEAVLEERAGDIFDQAENRLHVQKGILHWMVG